MIIDYATTEEGDKSKDSRSFGNSHALLIYGTVSKITISPKHAKFKMIAARIYSTQTEIEIPLVEETLVRLGFLMELKFSINMIIIISLVERILYGKTCKVSILSPITSSYVNDFLIFKNSKSLPN